MTNLSEAAKAARERVYEAIPNAHYVTSVLGLTWEQAAGLMSGASVVVPRKPEDEALLLEAFGLFSDDGYTAMIDYLAAAPKPGDAT